MRIVSNAPPFSRRNSTVHFPSIRYTEANPKGGGRVPAAEVFLLKNICADAALLFLAARFQGVRIRGARVAAGAVFGALCALGSATAGGAFAAFPAKAAVCAVMALIAAGRAKALRVCLSMWTGAMLLGGASRLGFSWLAAGVVSGMALCALCVRRAAPPAQDAQLRVVCGGRETRLRAIVDTGCRAVDPETLLPVIVLPAGAVRPPEDCRPLWVKTAAGRTSLSCFTPEAVFINGIPVSACVATAPGESLPHALIPVALCAGRRIG